MGERAGDPVSKIESQNGGRELEGRRKEGNGRHTAGRAHATFGKNRRRDGARGK